MENIVDLRRKERKIVPPSVSPAQQCTPCEVQIINNLTNMVNQLKDMVDNQAGMTELFKSINDCICKVQPILGTYYNKPETPILVATNFIPPFDQISNVDTGTPGYQREPVWATLNRLSKRITVINDGSVDLFVVASSDGQRWSLEAPIRVGEARTFFDTYELRIRGSQVGDVNTIVNGLFVGGVYRITEYDYWLAYNRILPTSSTITSTSPSIDKASLTNVPYPVANVNIITSATGVPLTPTNTPTDFRVQVTMSNGGTLSASIVNGANTQVVILNVIPGALIANGLYIFDILVHAGDTIDFQYNTPTTIQMLRVQEIDSASA